MLGDQSEVEKLLELGTQSLREGHLSDALLHYSAAIGMQLTNMYLYLALFPSHPTVQFEIAYSMPKQRGICHVYPGRRSGEGPQPKG